MRIAGTLYDSYSSRRHKAALCIQDGGFYAEMPDGKVIENLEFESVEDELPGTPRRIYFKSGRSFVPLGDLPPEFAARFETHGSRILARLERFSIYKGAVLFAVFIAFLAGIRLLLPVVADSIAMRVPQKIESRIGAVAFEKFDYAEFKSSGLNSVRVERLRKKAREMAVSAGFDPIPELYFRKSRLMGANAVAFPGGPVVLTDELVEHLDSDDLIVAVIAHEYAHIRARHTMKSIVRIAGLFAAMNLLFGADETIIEEMTATALAMFSLNYNRVAETEADILGVAILKKSGREASDLARALAVLNSLNQCSENEECPSPPNWLSTHPSTEERIEKLKTHW